VVRSSLFARLYSVISNLLVSTRSSFFAHRLQRASFALLIRSHRVSPPRVSASLLPVPASPSSGLAPSLLPASLLPASPRLFFPPPRLLLRARPFPPPRVSSPRLRSRIWRQGSRASLAGGFA